MKNDLEKLAKYIRYFILTSTTTAGSGHPTSSLSATDLMTVLLYGGFFRFDLEHPENPNNDRLIFSKGHASPLFYAMWIPATQAGTDADKNTDKRGLLKRAVEPEELIKSLRKFGSAFEGHPTMAFGFTEAATGSLGQGLSVGVGMALNAKLDRTNQTNGTYRTYVLLGDSEMSEGSVWEAIQLAAHYKLDNLIGILDVNRLGQRGETMYGHNLEEYKKRIEAFGWETIVVEDGHNFKQITDSLDKTRTVTDKPVMIIAKTIKGKGVSFIENKDGWHGKALSADELTKALEELGEVDKNVHGSLAKPDNNPSPPPLTLRGGAEKEVSPLNPSTSLRAGVRGGEGELLYPRDKPVATRKAYGNALVRIGADPRIVVLDAEVSNSTFSEYFKAKYPERFFEMYIAEQNMVGAALGLSRRGKIPFVSTFAAFFTRAFDQIRMSQYSDANIKFCGSHAGVSIGEDGPSQMGLEDIAMFRTLLGSVVLYPADAVSCEKLVEEAAKHHGMVYIRTTRKDTPIIYPPPLNLPLIKEEKKEWVEFPIGGSKVLRQSDNDVATVIGAGITLHEALAAHAELKKEGINIRVIDLYSVKPLDIETLRKAAAETKAIITVEDHFAEGGIGEAVAGACAGLQIADLRLQILAVRKLPKSGKPEELLDYEEISRSAIVKKVKEIRNGS